MVFSSFLWRCEDQHVALQVEGRCAELLREDGLLPATHVRVGRVATRTAVAQLHLPLPTVHGLWRTC